MAFKKVMRYLIASCILGGVFVTPALSQVVPVYVHNKTSCMMHVTELYHSYSFLGPRDSTFDLEHKGPIGSGEERKIGSVSIKNGLSDYWHLEGGFGLTSSYDTCWQKNGFAYPVHSNLKTSVYRWGSNTQCNADGFITIEVFNNGSARIHTGRNECDVSSYVYSE